MAERNPKFPIEVEIHKQRSLCRVGLEGGYLLSILTEKMTDRDKALLTCKVCKGIMRCACFNSDGNQLCVSCFPAYSTSRKTTNVAVRRMVSSLKCSCPLSERGCKWLGTLEYCEEHLDTCVYVRDKCKLGCGEVLQRNKLKVHEEKCLNRNKKCNHCNNEIIFCEMSKHLDKCPKMKVSCELKCGRSINREDVTQHLEQECGMKQERCSLECGLIVKRDEARTHVMDKCLRRKIPCEHCQQKFKFCEMPKHHKECPKAKVSCELKCGRSINREDMAQHVEQDCVETEVECPFVRYKCETKLKRKHVNRHLAEKETTHLGLRLTALEEFEAIHPLLRLNAMELQIDAIERNHEIRISRMNEHIKVLYSISNTTKLEWNIEYIHEFIQIYHEPDRRNVSGRDLSIHFFKENIYVRAGTHGYHDSFSAKFLIRLYSTIKCKVVKQYDCRSVNVYAMKNSFGDYIRCQVALISESDAEELSRTRSANKLILEMYITM